LCGDEGFFLFRFHLEVSEYGIEDSVNREGVIIIKVVVYGRLSVHVEALYCVEVDAFFWNCNTRMMSQEHARHHASVTVQTKGIHLDTIERFHIHRQAAIHNHLNDDHTLSVNRIFDAILGDFQMEPK